jgi:hypothetical protein
MLSGLGCGSGATGRAKVDEMNRGTQSTKFYDDVVGLQISVYDPAVVHPLQDLHQVDGDAQHHR